MKGIIVYQSAQDILEAIENISANDYDSRQDVIERNVVLQRNMQTSRCEQP